MSLADYLANNYLTADTKPPKITKRKKRKDGAQPGLIIADDDALGWFAKATATEEDDAPLNVNAHSAEFRKSRKNNWQILGSTAPSSADQATADAIIASATDENQSRMLKDEDAPVVEDTGPQMESGAHAGLQTTEQVTAQLKLKQEAEHKRFLAEGMERSGKGSETIYRDASGRIINVAMKRAEARKKADEEAAKVIVQTEAQKGDVQRVEREKRKEALKEAKFMPVARYADDAELNEELKEQHRWDDPAAQFLPKTKKGKSVTGKPLYAGPSMPNRYGIRPGHKWDGVDRGNGFEKEYFAAKNRRRDLKELDYAWQLDE
ncbi:MAG: hypothetical protein LQ341_000062 [Variospora aurantia]|nr:MAG: hypothetical protein LQ341_000062 [Variospora aurantia]